MKTLQELFHERFTPEPNTGCWLWTGTISQWWGYGQLRQKGAHRIAWELYRGPIPEGLVLDHVCRVRSCVNPDHLRVVTRRENTMAPGSLCLAKANAEKDCCPKCGSAYVHYGANKARACRPCRASNERHNAKRRGKRLRNKTVSQTGA